MSSLVDSQQGTKVYTTYPPTSPPPLPGPNYLRFILISDSHSQTCPVPPGDVLLHAGDLTTLGQPDDLRGQIEWLKSLPHKTKIFTCGNHDFSACTEGDFYETRGRELNRKYKVRDGPDDVEQAKEILSEKSLGEGLRYLNNEGWEFEAKGYRWKVWGSPWSPVFEDWAWNYTADQAKEIHSGIPKDIDILITHTPPHNLGRLDAIHNGTPVGCAELTRRLTLPSDSPEAIRPKLHVFGHIHEARGVHLLEREGEGEKGEGETVLVNAALVEYDLKKWQREHVFSYDVVCQPVIVDLRVSTSSGGTASL